MKRTIASLALSLLLVALMSSTAMAHSICVDKDRDYWCDECGILIRHTCVDVNKDTWCDKCSCWIPHTCADRDGDHLCDQCGTTMRINVHITVNSFLSETQNVHLTFDEGTYPSIFANTYGLSGQHTFTCNADSRFQLIVTKYGHVPRTFSRNTQHEDIYITTQLYPYGDISQDGSVSMGDVSRIYAHVRRTASITDDYALDCADTTGDGDISMGDVSMVYAHIRGIKRLF